MFEGMMVVNEKNSSGRSIYQERKRRQASRRIGYHRENSLPGADGHGIHLGPSYNGRKDYENQHIYILLDVLIELNEHLEGGKLSTRATLMGIGLGQSEPSASFDMDAQSIPDTEED
ncbi:hypothetical protein BGZ49_001839 [Haplosporangium sp. Z 27]|nr:hypothetical protein BGZ49_001839 [Haplosporangium sp. Z 27]